MQLPLSLLPPEPRPPPVDRRPLGALLRQLARGQVAAGLPKAFSSPAVVVGDHRGRAAGGPRTDGGTRQRADGHADRRVGYAGVRHWVRCSAGGLFSPTRCSAEGSKQAVVGVHVRVSSRLREASRWGGWDGRILERSNSWLTGGAAGFYFIVNKLNLLASPNLLERMCLKEAVGERSRDRRGDGRNAQPGWSLDLMPIGLPNESRNQRIPGRD